MRMKLHVVAFLLYISSHFSSAQPYVDIVSIQGFFTKPAHFVLSKTDVDVNWSCVQLTLPIMFKDSSLFILNPGYDNWGLNYRNEKLSLNSAFLPLTYFRKISPKSRLSFTFIPRHNAETAMKVDNKTTQFGGAAVYTWRKNPTLAFKAGVYYNKEFFGNYFLPLVGIDWKATDRLSIFGLLPNNLFVDYKVTEFLHTGFIYKGVTASFRLREEVAADYFRIQEGQLKLFVDFYLTKHMVLNLESGITAARSYGYGLLNEDQTDLDFNDSYLFKAGVYYRMWVK